MGVIMIKLTPEQRKAATTKSNETRRKNKEKKLLEQKERELLKDSLYREILSLKERRDSLLKANEFDELATKLCNKTLIAGTEIVDRAASYQPTCGIYFLCNDKEVLYVGQSISIPTRLATHFNDPSKHFTKVAYVPCEAKHLDVMESLYIHTLNPKLNGSFVGGRKQAPLSLQDILKLH